MKKKKDNPFKSILSEEQLKDLMEAKEKLLEIKKMLEDAKKTADELKKQENNKPIIFQK